MTNETINSIKLYMLDILFPNRCPLCGEFIKWNELCCKNCGDNAVFANDIICRGCGQEKCRCGKSVYSFDSVYAAFFFDGDGVRSAIYRFKHTGEPNLAELAAMDCVKHMSADSVPKPDIVVPVPMGRKKQRKRGHNQAEIFGKCLSKRLDIPIRRDILFKYDTDDEQHRHTERERKERVRELFRRGKYDLSGKSILLCDDVMTTGSTLNECGSILKDMGAESVVAAVCAVTRLNEREKGA